MVRKFKKGVLFFVVSLIIVLLFLFILGTFFDLKLSLLVYNKNSIYGIIGASFGELPAWFMLSIAGVIVYKISKFINIKQKKILCIAFSVILLTMSFLLIYYSESVIYNGLATYLNTWLRLLIAFLLFVFFVFFSFKVIDINDKYILIKIAFIILLTIIVQIVLTTLLKYIWSRPRFRLIALGSENYDVYDLFRSWYQPGKGLAGKVFADEASEQFKSFPSGHTSSAACSFLFFFIPSLNIRLRNSVKYRIISLIIAVIFTFVIAYSRIVYGAHYLTDVSFGFFITIFAILLSVLLEKVLLSRIIKHNVAIS